MCLCVSVGGWVGECACVCVCVGGWVGECACVCVGGWVCEYACVCVCVDGVGGGGGGFCSCCLVSGLHYNNRCAANTDQYKNGKKRTIRTKLV